MYHDTHPAISLTSRFTVAFMLMLAIALLIPWPFGQPESQGISPVAAPLSAPAQPSATPATQLVQGSIVTPTPMQTPQAPYP